MAGPGLSSKHGGGPEERVGHMQDNHPASLARPRFPHPFGKFFESRFGGKTAIPKNNQNIEPVALAVAAEFALQTGLAFVPEPAAGVQHLPRGRVGKVNRLARHPRREGEHQ